MREEFLEKREGLDSYAQDAALTDVRQTHLSEREARFWGDLDE